MLVVYIVLNVIAVVLVIVTLMVVINVVCNYQVQLPVLYVSMDVYNVVILILVNV